jgi:hypothetical protein
MTHCAWPKEMLAALDVALLGMDTACTVGEMLPSDRVSTESLFGDRWRISPNVALAVVGQKTKFRKGILVSLSGAFAFSAVYTNDDSEGESECEERIRRKERFGRIWVPGLRSENGSNLPSALNTPRAFRRPLTSLPPKLP